MNRADLVGDIVTNWHKYGRRRKTLVFCVDVAHSVHVRDEFHKVRCPGRACGRLTPKTERDAILARLASGETEARLQLHGSHRRLRSARARLHRPCPPNEAAWVVRQMAGRGLRPAPGQAKLILIDHSGAVYRHGLLEDRIEWTLDVNERATNPTHQTRIGKSSVAWSSAASAARYAPAAKPAIIAAFLPKRRPDAIIFRDGELARVDARGNSIETLDPNERARWHGMLVHYAKQRNYKPGWAKIQ